MEQVPRTGENHLLCGEIKDAFASFQHLQQQCATSAPLKALDGKLLSDRASVAARWQEHFSTLLNHLLCGEIKDPFASFRHLKQKCATSAPLKALDGKLLSDRASVAARWQEHSSTYT